MSLAVKFVKYGMMSAVCAVMFPSLLQAQSAQVQAGGEQALDVQTPQTAGAAGVSFAVGSPGNVSVYTNGFLLCTNVGTPSSSSFILRSQHEDQSTSGSLNRWTFATATDLGPISYTGTALTFNTGAISSPTLVCDARGGNGEMAQSRYIDDIYHDSFDDLFSLSNQQMPRLVNWAPPAAATPFDWASLDWTQVPFDGCDMSSPQVNEDVGCAALVGVDSSTTTKRSAIMDTGFDPSFTYFYYALHYSVSNQTGTDIPFVITDAYDSTFLWGTGASYCLTSTAPLSGNLSGSPCTWQTISSTTGTLRFESSALANSTSTSPSNTNYIIIKRKILGAHPNPGTPVVAVAIGIDPAVSSVGGNKFSGDDVVFGFKPTSNGFSWLPQPPPPQQP